MGGQNFRVRTPQRYREWFKYLVNAQTSVHNGMLDDAVEHYATVLRRFAVRGTGQVKSAI